MSSSNSILDSTKRALGIPSEYDVFDETVILHINSIFATLQQMGVGPDEGFMIVDDAQEWDSFTDTKKIINNVKSYMFLRVKLLFDPPTTGFTTESMTRQVTEMEWRLQVAAQTARGETA